MGKYVDVDKLLTTVEAAEYLGLSKAYLERDRWQGAIVPYLRIGQRTIRYRKSDLDKFIDSCMGPRKREDLLCGGLSNV